MRGDKVVVAEEAEQPCCFARPSIEDVTAALRRCSIIPSVKDEESLEVAIASDAQVVFILFGSLLDLEDIVARVKAAGQYVFVDVDLLEGFAARPVIIEHLLRSTDADGIVSRRDSMVKAAKARGLIAGHRFYLIDTAMYKSIVPRTVESEADFIEVLPGCIPRAVSWLREETDVPVIAGGLLFDSHDVRAAFDAGASAVATSRRSLWQP
jgi:glycerol uptake operon antiterminator